MSEEKAVSAASPEMPPNLDAAARYGARFFGVQRADSEVLMFMADRMTIEAGALCLWGGFRKAGDEEPRSPLLLASFAPGRWLCAWSASVFDGRAGALDDDDATIAEPRS